MFTRYSNNLGLDPTLGLTAPNQYSRFSALGGNQGVTLGVNPYTVFGPGPTTVPLNPTGAPLASLPTASSSASGFSSTMTQMFQMMIMMKQLDSLGQAADDSAASDTSSSEDIKEMLKLQMMGSMFSSGGNNNMFSNLAMMSMFDKMDFDFDSASGPSKRSSYTSVKGVKVRDLSPEFKAKVDDIAKELNCDPMDLLAVMNSESSLDHRAVNDKWIKNSKGKWVPPTYATGLIQFMPKTARSLGTTVEALKKMTPEKQLDYVKKYLKQSKEAAGMSSGQALSGADLFALIYLPGRADRETLSTRGEAYYDQNTALDVNRDGRITKKDLAKMVQAKRDKLQKQS